MESTVFYDHICRLINQMLKLDTSAIILSLIMKQVWVALTLLRFSLGGGKPERDFGGESKRNLGGKSERNLGGEAKGRAHNFQRSCYHQGSHHCEACCPGVKVALDKMPDNGVILVVTDAGTKQKNLEESINGQSVS